MRLLIDFSAGFSQGAGIGRYARNVVAAALPHLTDWEIRLLYAAGSRRPEPFLRSALELFGEDRRPVLRRVPLSRRWLDILWFRVGLRVPVDLIAGRCNLIYSPDFTAPPVLSAPSVMTVHDLAFLVKPEFAPTALRDYLTTVVPKEVRRAASVAVVSETTRRDVIERFAVNPERVALVPNGVEDRFFVAAPLTGEQRRRLALPAEYLLTVGTLEPRKNHLTLFRAIEALGSNLGMPLVVAGKPGWSYQEIVNEGNRLEAQGKVIMADYVPDEDLPGLYAGAAAVVYPSWYEGFGLPVVEGLAAGVPVVTSDAPSLVEVGGDATISAPADSAEGIGAAIERALGAEHRTETAIASRRERAGRYRWDVSGQTLANVLREVEVGRRVRGRAE